MEMLRNWFAIHQHHIAVLAFHGNTWIHITNALIVVVLVLVIVIVIVIVVAAVVVVDIVDIVDIGVVVVVGDVRWIIGVVAYD